VYFFQIKYTQYKNLRLEYLLELLLKTKWCNLDQEKLAHRNPTDKNLKTKLLKVLGCVGKHNQPAHSIHGHPRVGLAHILVNFLYIYISKGKKEKSQEQIQEIAENLHSRPHIMSL
jgi:hypothetical protein